MPNYKAMYLALFNSVTDAIEMLQKAQQDAEEKYISEAELIEFPENTDDTEL
ncbi:MAG: hypothetical protein LBN00_10585 [Oscillospiraceae bacterium]|jgi:hypothetical protein|nr:hypothetical protein [Oscillospiraceae bacterium]